MYTLLEVLHVDAHNRRPWDEAMKKRAKRGGE